MDIIIITVMVLLQNYTTTDQQDYYLAREVTYAAMYDAIDYGYYKKNGELKNEKIIHYKMFFRSTGKAKAGECMFINEKLYKKAIDFIAFKC